MPTQQPQVYYKTIPSPHNKLVETWRSDPILLFILHLLIFQKDAAMLAIRENRTEAEIEEANPLKTSAKVNGEVEVHEQRFRQLST